MGYESRIYVISRVQWPNATGFVFGNELAQFEVLATPYSEINHEFIELFKKPIDYDLTDGGRTDAYGDHCKSADVATVRDWLRGFLTDRHGYARMRAFLGYLEGLEGLEGLPHMQGLQLVHYGH